MQALKRLQAHHGAFYQKLCQLSEPQRTPGPREASDQLLSWKQAWAVEDELGFQGGEKGALQKEIAVFVKSPGLFWMEV